MTKQEFLNGVSFKVKGYGNYKGGNTYKYAECIVEESRSSIDDKVVLSSYHCNVLKIGSKAFSGFAFIMGKRVNIKYRFEDLIAYEENVGE
jgi:hypothetical protein